MVKPGKGFEFILARRYLIQRITCTSGLSYKRAIFHLSVFQTQTQETTLRIIHKQDGTVLLIYRIVNYAHIAIRINLIKFVVTEEGFHLTSRYLIESKLISRLHCQGLVDDMCPVNGTIGYINLNLFSQQLFFAIP